MLRLLPLFFVGAALTAMAFAPTPVPKGTKAAKKAATIDGTWEVVERHVNGHRDDSASPIRWTIKGESLVVEARVRGVFRQVKGPRYRLVKPAGGRANEIDYVLTPADRGGPPSTFRGRFGLDGDTLKVCRAHSPEQDRPAGCNPSAGADLYVFKRVKDGKKDE
jgi:uncharacterized protein (TIGR03067 family)